LNKKQLELELMCIISKRIYIDVSPTVKPRYSKNSEESCPTRIRYRYVSIRPDTRIGEVSAN